LGYTTEYEEGKMMNRQLEGFRQKCAGFDWQWDFSDDQDTWRAGRIAQQCLFSEAMQIGPEALELYFSYIHSKVDGS
jgi:hypothetical protein